jgi:hypothetical protein
MFHIVQPYGVRGNFHEATVVASFATLEAAWAHLDQMQSRMMANRVSADVVDLVIVDDARRLACRPRGMVH